MTEATHTPTPWYIPVTGEDVICGADHAIVAQTIGKNFSADAALIVSAVNAYPLINEAAEVLRDLALAADEMERVESPAALAIDTPTAKINWSVCQRARALLSKLEGGK